MCQGSVAARYAPTSLHVTYTALYVCISFLVVCVSTHLEEVGVPEGCTEAENVISLWMFRDGLHDGTVHDNEMLGSRLHGAAFPGIARVKKESGALQTDPVALPASLPRQLNLMLLPEKPLLHTQETGNKNIHVNESIEI